MNHLTTLKLLHMVVQSPCYMCICVYVYIPVLYVYMCIRVHTCIYYMCICVRTYVRTCMWCCMIGGVWQWFTVCSRRCRAVGVLVDNLQSVSQENITNVVITLANLARNTETHPLVRRDEALCTDIPLPCVTTKMQVFFDVLLFNHSLYHT